MYELARIQKYSMGPEGTKLEIFIPNINLQESIVTKHINKCEVRFDDGRHISIEQRKKAYATIRDISIHTGYLPEEMKEQLKYLHILRTGCNYFSLSDCTIDTAREFINTIMDYALENGVILDDLGINRTDDINAYLYSCYKRRKCAVCGADGEIHHWDAIGMGNDRDEIDDSDLRKICLCRKHHTEAHTVGIIVFEERHKVYGIIIKND